MAHEVAHIVRYLSPTSQSDLHRLVAEAGGYYDYWATGSRATLRELLVNEGLATHASMAVAPGFIPASYFGYAKRQYNRLRELEAFLRRSVEPDLDRAALGPPTTLSERRDEPWRAPGPGQGAAGAVGILPGPPDVRGAGSRTGTACSPSGRRRGVPTAEEITRGIQTA